MQIKLAALLALLGAASGLKVQNKLQRYHTQMFAETDAKQSSGHTCHTSIDRIKDLVNQPTYQDIINQNTSPWQDSIFTESESVYWSDFTDQDFRVASGSTYIDAFDKYPTSNIHTPGSNYVDGVDQGSLGDCYFLGGLAALGEYPDVLADRILTDSVNAAHIFAAKVFIRGVQHEVYVDGRLWLHPYDVLHNAQVPDNGDLFVPFMEKIYAKINGNYEVLSGGNAYETFNLLLGSPNLYMFFDEPEIGYDYADDAGTRVAAQEQLWSLITQADDNGWLLAASCYTSGYVNLVSNHLYTLVTYVDVTVDGDRKRLVVLRNPWAREEFDGLYSKDSTEWTCEISDAIDPTFDPTADDGWIAVTLDELIDHFDVLEIAHYNPNAVQSTFELIDFQETQKSFTVDWPGGNAAFTIDHYHKRMYPHGCRNDQDYYSWSQARLSLYDASGNQIQGTWRTYDAKMSNNFLEVGTLAQGTYTLDITVDRWAPNAVQDLTVRIYGDAQATISEQTEEEAAASGDAQLNALLEAGISGCPNGAWSSPLTTSSGTALFQYERGYQWDGEGYNAFVGLTNLHSCSSLMMDVTLKNVADVPAVSGTTCQQSGTSYVCPFDFSGTTMEEVRFAYPLDPWSLSTSYSIYTYSCP